MNFMIEINYEDAKNFKTNLTAAVSYYLNSVEWSTLILYPQALNPFLTIMEKLKEVRHIMILPTFNSDIDISQCTPSEFNQPAYLIVKMPETPHAYVQFIEMSK